MSDLEEHCGTGLFVLPPQRYGTRCTVVFGAVELENYFMLKMLLFKIAFVTMINN